MAVIEEVREMRDAETILAIIGERGIHNGRPMREPVGGAAIEE